MIAVSEEFKKVMAERRDFRLYAQAALADGTELALDGEDFTITGNSLTDGAGTTGLPLGAAVCRQMCLELANDDGHLDGTDFFGARFRVWLTLELAATTERIELGTFTAVEPATLGETVTVTAWDDMYRADRDYETDLSFPATLGSMFRDICQRCGIGYDTAAFPNDGYLVQAAPEECTCRQMLGWIAMLAGGNARVDRTGRLRIIPYDMAAEPALELTEWGSLETGTDDVIVTGLSMAVDGEDGTERTELYGEEGYVLAAENPLVPAGGEQAALALMGAGLVGLPLRPFQGEHAALPMAEFMDVVLVRDRKGRTCKSVLTDVDFAVGGFTSLSSSAEPAVRNASRYVTPEARALQTARKLVDRERTARQTAVEQLARTLVASGGLYSTAQEQEDGSVIYYLHDKPTLAASRSVMKLTAQAIGFSTDGGKTWPFGFSVTGEMVMGIIRAEGLNADWVKFGTFEQARVEGLPELASNMEVLRERITAAVEGVQTAVTSVTAEYTLSASNALDEATGQPVDAQWSEALPGDVPDDMFLWTRQKIVCADGSVKYAGMYCVSGVMQDAIGGTLDGIQETVVKNASDINILQDRVTQQVSQTAANLDGIYQWQSAMEQRASQLEIQFREQNVDQVTTSNGFTFNKDGLQIWEANSQIATVIQNTGMEVRRYQPGSAAAYDTMLTADAGGVTARDLTAENYLIIAHARFERYENDRTGCFYI